MKASKIFIGSLAAAMILTASLVIPVFAEEAAQTESAAPAEAAKNTFVSEDGVLSIDLPDNTWAEIQDPTSWIVLSNGADQITIDHFSNGDVLPAIATADSRFVNTLTAAYSTQNEVFVAKGFVTAPEKQEAVNASLLSIKILKYDTKQAVASTPANQASTTTAQGPDPNVPYETYLVYSQGSGRPVTITGNSGVFIDSEGITYYAMGNGMFADVYGAYYTTWQPESAPDTEVIGLVSDGSGRPVTIMENEDGTYTDQDGNQYYEDANGGFVDDYDATYEVTGTNYDY